MNAGEHGEIRLKLRAMQRTEGGWPLLCRGAGHETASTV